MPTKTRRTTQDLRHSVEDPEKILHGSLGGQSTTAMTVDVGGARLSGCEENTSEVTSTIVQALAAAEAARDKEKSSASRPQYQKKMI